MVILSGSNIGSTQSSSLPSPARGSPPGLSPNKSSSGVTPELTGLERMLNGWRRQAEKKAQQVRQRDLDGLGKREKEQRDVNEIRVRLIESRMKKLEQQQQTSTKNAKNNGTLVPSDPTIESSRKRRSDDDYYLSTPSDGGFSCDSPDSFSFDGSACLPKNAKFSTSITDKPSPLEKNASVFIETFQLPPPPQNAHSSNKRSNAGRSNACTSVANQSMTSPYSGGFDFSAATGNSANSAMSSQIPTRHRVVGKDQQAAAFRGPIVEVALPRDIEEEMIRSLPINLDAALTPDFLRAVDDLDWPLSNVRAPPQPPPQSKAITNISASSTNLAMQYSSARSNSQQPPPPPPYPMQQQQYSAMLQQQSQPQQAYSTNGGSASGGWHNQQAFVAPPPPYPNSSINPYAINNGPGRMQLPQLARGWPEQNLMGNGSPEFGRQF